MYIFCFCYTGGSRIQPYLLLGEVEPARVGGCMLWLGHPTHFILTADLLHTYIWQQPIWILCEILTGMMLYVMIEAPYPVHTHSSSALYIYKVFQHLLQWLVVIRMQHHTDICSVEPESGCPWRLSWILCWFLWNSASLAATIMHS